MIVLFLEPAEDPAPQRVGQKRVRAIQGEPAFDFAAQDDDQGIETQPAEDAPDSDGDALCAAPDYGLRSNYAPQRASVDTDRPRPPAVQGPSTSGPLDRLHTKVDVLASSFNISESQFKNSLLRRLRGMEEENRKLAKLLEETMGVVKSLNERLNRRPDGVPCDMVERFNSMTNFCYAWCKGAQDQGIYRLPGRPGFQ